jgi:four helix bundle protein
MNEKKNHYKKFGRDLEERTRRFAVLIIKLAVGLPANIEANVIRNQIVKSGTSIGANYREANRSRSRADFRNKIRICESEAGETQYWLEIINGMNWPAKDKWQEAFVECGELLAIFTTIARKSSQK